MTSSGTTARRRVFLGLGSNLGDRLAYLRGAVAILPDVVAVSSIYETEPVGTTGEQGPYLNAVVELLTELDAPQVLGCAQRAEQAALRVRAERNGPRTLDVDVLLFGDEKINTPDLQVPHPRMWERRFVLQPLAELAPELLPANWEANVTGRVWLAGTL